MVFLIRSADARHHVKTAAIEEHIHHQAVAVRTVDSCDAFEPGMSGFRLTGLIGYASAAALDTNEPSENGIPPGLYA
jgi:hypothetical protein